MRALGRLILLPFQLVASWLLFVTTWLVYFAHRPAGYVLRGDWCAFTYASEERGSPEFDDRWSTSALAWIWRPRFVAPKGPTVF